MNFNGFMNFLSGCLMDIYKIIGLKFHFMYKLWISELLVDVQTLDI